jgi:hypothetical protein
MLVYFLLFNFLPSEKCGFNDWKPPVGMRASKPCNCSGIIKYDHNIYGNMECIGKIINYN